MKVLNQLISKFIVYCSAALSLPRAFIGQLFSKSALVVLCLLFSSPLICMNDTDGSGSEDDQEFVSFEDASDAVPTDGEVLRVNQDDFSGAEDDESEDGDSRQLVLVQGPAAPRSEPVPEVGWFAKVISGGKSVIRGTKEFGASILPGYELPKDPQSVNPDGGVLIPFQQAQDGANLGAALFPMAAPRQVPQNVPAPQRGGNPNGILVPYQEPQDQQPPDGVNFDAMAQANQVLGNGGQGAQNIAAPQPQPPVEREVGGFKVFGLKVFTTYTVPENVEATTGAAAKGALDVAKTSVPVIAGNAAQSAIQGGGRGVNDLLSHVQLDELPNNGQGRIVEIDGVPVVLAQQPPLLGAALGNNPNGDGQPSLLAQAAKEVAKNFGEGAKEGLLGPGGAKQLAKEAAQGANEVLGGGGNGPLWKRILPSKWSTFIGLTVGAAFVIGAVVLYKYISHRFDKHLKRPKLSYTLTKPEPYYIDVSEERPWFKEMVFAPDIKDRLNAVLLMTGKIHQKIEDGDKQATYRNMLLYGPPDSGKRKFVHQLAQYAQMDLYEIESSGFTMDEADAKIAVEDFFKNEASKNVHGAIVFIDDASMLFSNTDSTDGANGNKMVAAFIEAVKKPNNRFMVVLATHTKPRLTDRRIDSLIHEWIEIKLPELQERIKALQLARQNCLLSDDEAQPEFVQSVLKHLSDERIRDIAGKLKGTTIGALCGIMQTIKVRAESQGWITAELVDQVVDDVVKRYRDLIN